MDSTLKVRRLTKELKEIKTQESKTSLIKVLHAESFDQWTIQLKGAPNTLYADELFKLKVFASYLNCY